MKVLLVNQYYPPDGAATATLAAGFASTLGDRGHEVSVIAGRPSYDVAQRSSWRPLQVTTDAKVRVRRVGSTAFARHRMAGRLANYGTYAAWAAPLSARDTSDLVVSMSDPPFAGIIAARVAHRRNRPFVYWLQDLHPDFALATGDLRPGPLVDRWRRLHSEAMGRAAAVVVLGDDMADRAIVAGADARRLHVIRSGAPPAKSTPPADNDVARTIRADREFVVLHAGNLGQTVAWETLIDGVKLLGDPGVGLAFVGPGAERAAAERAATGLAAVRFHDYWPAEHAPAVFAAGDVHAVTVRRGLEGLVVPSRLYAVLAAGRPVLAIADEASDVVALVRRHDCGVVADPDDPASIADAIAWARAHPSELAAMGQRAGAASADYDRDALLHRLVDVIESVRR
ncbi:MAG: glycosyltransferase family 4 protein [Actinobacteria bacterium]|nr:glycosyltransferase family 4 protein [Actinomycetota bacterium]